jgi:predicted nuclease of predicted toxin-antitoxin system
VRVLLDNNVNHRFTRLITGHDVIHVQDIGWEDLQNGELIATAESAGYDVMITADKRMQYQQSLKGRKISIIVLNSRRIIFEDIAPLAPQVLATLEHLPQGSFVTIQPE